MVKPYIVPSWAGAPVDEIFLEVLKDGQIIDKIDIGPSKQKDHFILGRQPDIVDLLMEHPSISRQHAALQFRDDGALMLCDLQSAQGTFINKEKLDGGIYQRLYVGDMIKFGASTRLYILGGPSSHQKPEYDSENLQAYRKQLKNRTLKVQAEETVRNMCGWGFCDDAEVEEEDEEDDEDSDKGPDQTNLPEYLKRDENYDRKYGSKYKAAIKETEVNEKDAATLEKIRKNERKIQNMQEEIRRIYMKESSQDNGLTAGQSAAIDRNDERIAQLVDDNNALVKLIHEKNANRDGTASAASTAGDSFGALTKRKHNADQDEDEDAVLDTTDKTADSSLNWRLRKRLSKQGHSLQLQLQSSGGGGADAFGSSLSTLMSSTDGVTYEMLVAEKQMREARLSEIRVSCESLACASSVDHDHSQQQQKEEDEEEDEIDRIMRNSLAKENEVKLHELRKEEANISNSMRRLDKLIQIAKPAILPN